MSACACVWVYVRECMCIIVSACMCDYVTFLCSCARVYVIFCMCLFLIGSVMHAKSRGVSICTRDTTVRLNAILSVLIYYYYAL